MPTSDPGDQADLGPDRRSGYFVHPQGLCESTAIGDDTRVWAFAHVLLGARLGADCNICDHVFIENDVILGDRVTVKSGVQLWDGLRLGDDVFVGPNVTFTNDRFPRSKRYPDALLTTTVEDGASVGAGAVILPGITIGQNAMVGAGAVVTKNVPANAVVVGNPARIVGYVDDGVGEGRGQQRAVAKPLRVAELIELTAAHDLRGSLMAVEMAKDLPFVPERFFTIFDVPSEDVRGEHAHRVCEQLLVCLRGSVMCLVDDGSNRKQALLDRPTIALYMPAMTWGAQYQYSADALLAVFASHPYDPDDYIRTYDEFLEEVARVRDEGG
jgi:UDP-2-acetamido-3-amino-2,3-dideoxy-glucuronate N-acetyltransferase